MSDLLLFLIVISTLIIGHEFGHFLAARFFGLQVEEFGFGFPPRIAKLFQARGTVISLNWIPLGGFVKIAGEDDPNVPGGLSGSRKIVRAGVAFAGPAANILLGFLAFLLAYKFAAPDFEQVLIADLVDEAPAMVSGIRVGDIVRTVDDKPITSFESMQEVIADRLGTPIVIGLERDDQLITVTLIPRTEYPAGQGPIGVTLGYPARDASWVEATQMGFDSVGFQFKAIISLPGRLIRGTIASEEARVSGLKGIHDMLAWANEIDTSAQRPFFTLNIIGAISIGLALANLLPFPALDGGRLLFVLFEAVFRRRIPPRYEGLAHAIGFAIMLALLVYINIQDFINPISLP